MVKKVYQAFVCLHTFCMPLNSQINKNWNILGNLLFSNIPWTLGYKRNYYPIRLYVLAIIKKTSDLPKYVIPLYVVQSILCTYRYFISVTYYFSLFNTTCNVLWISPYVLYYNFVSYNMYILIYLFWIMYNLRQSRNEHNMAALITPSSSH